MTVSILPRAWSPSYYRGSVQVERSVSAHRLLPAFVLCGAVSALLLTMAGGAAAAGGDGFDDPTVFHCGAACEQQPVIVARAGMSYPPGASQTYRSMEYNWQTNRNRAQYRERKEREAREKAERRERLDSSYRYGGYETRSPHRQPGGYCIYDANGNVVLKPDGVVCDEQQDEDGYMAGSSGEAESGAKKAGASGTAPSQTGCIAGDCKNGPGTYVWSNGAQYVGQFQNGLQNGEGTLILPDGASYVGQWRAGKRHGQGTATYADGRIKKGMWRENRFVGESSTALVKIRWPDLSKPALEVGGGKRDAAVVVGIENYAQVARVSHAANNASDWYAYLVQTRRVPLENVILMLDEDATVEEMRWAVEEAAKRVKRKGTLWFVFIGHGAPAKDGKDGLLVGFDTQQKARSIEARSLRRSELLETLANSKAKRIQVLLDACFSGRATDGRQLVAGLQPLVVTNIEPVHDERLTLMTAAGSAEYAGPLPGASRPAFSYLALGGLRGWADDDGDGEVTAGELHGYVTQAMRALIRDRRQRPTLVGESDTVLGQSARERGPDLAQIVLESARSGR